MKALVKPVKRRKSKPHPYLIAYQSNQHRILGALMMAFSAMLMVSMITYWIPENSVWSNLGGPLGHNLSRGVFQLLGFSGFSVPILLFLWGENRFGQLPPQPLIKISLFLIGYLLSIMLFFGSLLNPENAQSGLGFVERTILHFLQHFLGNGLTILLLCFPLLFLTVRYILPQIDFEKLAVNIAGFIFWMRGIGQKLQARAAAHQHQPTVKKPASTENKARALTEPIDLDPDMAIRPQANAVYTKSTAPAPDPEMIIRPQTNAVYAKSTGTIADIIFEPAKPSTSRSHAAEPTLIHPNPPIIVQSAIEPVMTQPITAQSQAEIKNMQPQESAVTIVEKTALLDNDADDELLENANDELPDELIIVESKNYRSAQPIPPSSADGDIFDQLGVERPFNLPPLDLLDEAPPHRHKIDRAEVTQIAASIEENLAHYSVTGKVVAVHPGPVITRYEYKPDPGIKISKITNLSDDLALVLSARQVRFQAPVPGKPVVGIEVPNQHSETVYLREILESKAFKKIESPLPMALGKDTAGMPVAADLTKMPHLLIAGATGSGKSVGVNSIITSILYRSGPEEVRFLMIDPKMLELSVYNGIPHLHRPVVTDRKDAVKVLKWAVWEMERRYRMLSKFGVRNIKSFNKYVDYKSQSVQQDIFTKSGLKPLPYIVIIIDELADLMMTVANEIEELLARLAQMARAIGIHLILATQRPSVDVITGLIKANFPSRMSFQSASKVDSRTILDQNGAEKLLGNGDMLFLPSTSPEPIRLHGSYVSSEETHAIVKFLAQQAGNEYTPYDTFDDVDFAEQYNEDSDEIVDSSSDLDLLFQEAKTIVISQQMASVSLLQRRLKIGYARAGRLVDQLHDAGVVGPHEGSKSRKVLVKSHDNPVAAPISDLLD